MIEIQVNAKTHRCPVDTSVAALLEQLGYHCEQVAVAIDNEFVARADYTRRLLRNAEQIDVLVPVQGG